MIAAFIAAAMVALSAAVVGGSFGASFLIATKQKKEAERIRKQRFPQIVPGIGCRMKDCPFDLDIVGTYLKEHIRDWAKRLKVPETQALKKAESWNCVWVPGQTRDPETGPERTFKRNGDWRAGLYDPNIGESWVAFLEDDTVGWTASGHEMNHHLDFVVNQLIDVYHTGPGAGDQAAIDAVNVRFR